MAVPTRYLRMMHLGWQDDQRPNRLGVIDTASCAYIQAPFCGERVMFSDVIWLERPLAYDLSIDTRDMCQGCLAEYVERRLIHPVNIVHSSYGRADGRALCGAPSSFNTVARVVDATSCSACIAILRGS
jgi:hypothetical protein